MSSEEDPKEVAKKERRSPQVERLLRQFVTDGPKGNGSKYLEGWQNTFGDKCLDCDGFGEINGKKCPTCDGSGKKKKVP